MERKPKGDMKMNWVRFGYYLGIVLAFIASWHMIVYGIAFDNTIFINVGMIMFIFLVTILAVYLDKSIKKLGIW